MHSQVDGSNVLGAIIFFSYIGAALVFAGIIADSLSELYARRRERQTSNRVDGKHAVHGPDKAQLFLGLSVLSFAVLSFHMLSFLIQSYVLWSEDRSLLRPTSLLDVKGLVSVEAWSWATSSTLFKDFAQVICNDPHRFWWTQQALLYSIGWNIFMSLEGQRRAIPRLWAYFVLDQILPISFTQNLFCTALILSGPPPQDQVWTAPRRWKQFAVTIPYLFGVSLAPASVPTEWFFVVVFVTRLLLFAPYLTLRPQARRVDRTKVLGPHDLYPQYWVAAALLLLSSTILVTTQTFKTEHFSTALKAINDSPAVAALGYDYLIAFASLVLFFLLGQSSTPR